jgi:hypothetical protein
VTSPGPYGAAPVPPLNAPPPGVPGVGVTPGASPAVEFARVIVIYGTGVVGLFEYEGTPGAGNPPIAYVAPPGETADLYGNALPYGGGGFVTVAPGISYAALTDGGLGMALTGATASVIIAVLGVTLFGAGSALQMGSGSVGAGVQSLLTLGDSLSDAPGLQVLSGLDGAAYDTQRATLANASPLTVDSTSPVTLVSFTGAPGTYAVTGDVTLNADGTGTPAFRVSTTMGEDLFEFGTVLDGGTAGGYTQNGYVLNTLTQCGPALVSGDSYSLKVRGVVILTGTAATVALEMAATAAVATATIPAAGALFHILPVTVT